MIMGSDDNLYKLILVEKTLLRLLINYIMFVACYRGYQSVHLLGQAFHVNLADEAHTASFSFKKSVEQLDYYSHIFIS